MTHAVTAEYECLSAVAVAESMADFERAVVAHCSKRFSVQSVIVIRYQRNGAPTVPFRWIPDDTLRLFFDRYYEELGYMLDPFFRCAFSVDDWGAFALREIAPDRFETSEYFSNYFGATRMVDEVGFVARLDENSSVHLSMGRNLGQRRFRAGEVARFKLLSRVLAPKLRQISARQPTEEPIDAKPLSARFYALATERGTEISRRESEVAALIVQGHSSRAISLNLGISPHTVKVHRRSLYRKLGISSQSDLFGLLANFHDLPELTTAPGPQASLLRGIRD